VYLTKFDILNVIMNTFGQLILKMPLFTLYK